MAKPPDHLSPSGWTLFEQCPRKWAAKYVYGVEDTVGWEAEVGTFAHRVLEWMMTTIPMARRPDSARKIAGRVWETSLGEGAASIARGEITERAFKQRAWNAIVGLWSLEDPAEVDVVATEQQFDWREGDVPMRCIVDRIDRHPRGSLTPGLVVNDYKSGRLPKPKHQTSHKRQVTIGALAVASQEGPLAVAEAGSLLYLTAETSVGAPTSREARRAVSEQAQRVWADIVAACEAEEFPATAGPLCPWCSLAGDCREGSAWVDVALTWKKPPPLDAPGVRAFIEAGRGAA